MRLLVLTILLTITLPAACALERDSRTDSSREPEAAGYFPPSEREGESTGRAGGMFETNGGAPFRLTVVFLLLLCALHSSLAAPAADFAQLKTDAEQFIADVDTRHHGARLSILAVVQHALSVLGAVGGDTE